ncbi:MAG TPA: MFS transporter [Phototrophicaceae bacterium]|nr:MFS transporter [Phototrophicaceae bacterium]
MHKPADNRLLWAVNLGHMTNDVFMSMRAVLLAFISAAIMPLANWQIGLAISAGELVGAVSQPVFGWLADKTGGRWLGAGGVVWTASGIMLAMLVVAAGGGFWLMLIPLALAALGSGAFHPVGSLYAANVNPARSARNAAFFFMFGQLGLGLGPALAGLLLENARPAQSLFGPVFQTIAWERGSISPIFVLLLLVFPAAVLMALTIPNRRDHVAQMPVKTIAAPTERAAIPVLPFVILLLAVSLRSLANPAIVSFIPQMFQQKGWTPSQYGLLTSAFWVASGIAGIIFGYIGDRFDLRRVVMVSVVIAVPGIFLLPGLDGAPAFALAILVGAMSGSHSLIVVLAQSLLPGRMGLASGIILGLIFCDGRGG